MFSPLSLFPCLPSCRSFSHRQIHLSEQKPKTQLQYPAARAYYELSAATLKFILPEPSFLEGVKSKDRAILKLRDVTFSYPGSDRLILDGVTVQCCLNSRIAVTGPNGAGKSTMIKLLTGETEPNTGEVWKHPNLRIAYVAQHAFHHLEM